MVSSKLTDEEQLLKKQYQLLKNLKKELKQLTLKRKQEEVAAAENGPPSAKQKKAMIQGSKTPSKQHEFSSGGPSYHAKLPTTINAAANTEAAKKLLKSGAIQLKVEKKTSFKRSSTFKSRNLDDGQKKPVKHFGVGSDSAEEEASDDHETPVSKPKSESPKKFKPYSETKEGKSKFVRKERKSDKKAPRRGNTLYVLGFVVNETMIKNNFSTFGNIIGISIERDKNGHEKGSGFVSFDTYEAAEEAIKEMDDALIDDCRIKVSLARRQPMQQQVKNSTPWVGLADRGDKGNMERENRTLVSYEDELF